MIKESKSVSLDHNDRDIYICKDHNISNIRGEGCYGCTYIMGFTSEMIFIRLNRAVLLMRPEKQRPRVTAVVAQ
jgi:hypothetical protein